MEVEKLISDFKEIMDNYPQVMTENQKDHPFAKKMRNDFRDDLRFLVESISDYTYHYRISPGMMGKWANPPWAGIKNTTFSDKFTEGLYVIYHFRVDDNIIDLSINQGLDTIKRSEAISIARKLRKHVNLLEGFSLDDDPDFSNSQTAILFKKYDINNIDIEEFIHDLKNLLEVYDKIIPIYNDISSNNNLQNDDISEKTTDEKNYWLFAPGPSANMWDVFYEKNVMGLGGDYLGDLNKYASRENIIKALQKHFHNKSRYPNDSLAYWQFVHEIKPGDIIFAKKGIHEIVGYGVVESGYNYDERFGEYAHVLSVNWKEKGNWHHKGNLITKALTKITDYPDLVETITNYFETYPDTIEKVQKENDSTYSDTMTNKDYGLLNVNNKNIWRIIPGSTEIREETWQECKEKGFISIGFSSGQTVDYSKYKSVEDLRDLLLDVNADIPENTTAPQMVWNFVNEIKVNDIIVANNGRYGKIYGIGIVKSDYIPPEKVDFEIKGKMKHIRRVDWIISDEFSTDINFDIKTLAPVKSENWNKIVKAYNNLNENLKLESFKSIYNEFKNTYYYSIQSEELRSKYFECSEKFKKDFNDIKISINDGNDETDKIFYNLIYPTNTLFAGYASDIKQLIKKTYNRSEEDLNRLAIKYLNLIDKYTENDGELRVELIKFDDDELTKSIKTAYISASLYYLDNNRFYAINQKTISTIKFLSNYININLNFDNKLVNYIESNEKYHRYIKMIGEYIPELGNYEMFDHFCHWICDKKLGYYANSGKLPLCISNFTEENEQTDIIDTKAFNINPINIQTSLKINKNVLYQTAAILNSPKNIIFEGVPGTGKTRLAMDICEYAKEENFCDDYLITTATSDWTTFDVIGGLMPDSNGNLNFEEGIFLKAIRENKLLIIDEINRADIDKAFGQLFTVLSGSPVKLNYKIDDNNISIDHTDELESYYDNSNKTYFIGKNFRILATMNNYDKDSLYELSYAFMRRFAFVELDIPNEEDFKNLIDMWNDELLVSLPSELIDDIKILLGIRYYRKLGPAIFYDMINYMVNRLKLDSTEYLLEECILLYILPQFEGLSRNKLADIKNLLVSNNLVREEIVTEKFNELGGLNF